jgi:hypothetical protein
VLFYAKYQSLWHALLFVGCLSPVLCYFLHWFAQVYRDDRRANYTKTMGLNFISATALNVFAAVCMLWQK